MELQLQLQAGLCYTSQKKVTEQDAAVHHGSGTLEVFATPALVALMENAAMNAVQSHLPAGCTTVGIEICATHSKATPMKAQVQSTATLSKVEGKKLFFDIVAGDEQGEIGRATHVRYVVEAGRFMERVGI